MSNEEKIKILQAGLRAAIRWTVDDTAKIVYSNEDVKPFSEEFKTDVYRMRQALKVQP